MYASIKEKNTSYGSKLRAVLPKKHYYYDYYYTGLARSFHKDTERGIQVLLYFEVLQRDGA